ncbi:MAG: hypothetical protein WD771_09595, partial [Gemmatimonadaceae bacterium]
MLTQAARLREPMVRGVVYDCLPTCAPWGVVEVQLLGTPLRAVTDAPGRFVIDGAPSGWHEVVVVDREIALLRVPLSHLNLTGAQVNSSADVAWEGMAMNVRILEVD